MIFIWILWIFTDWKYCVIQCTGYLKSWAPAKIDLEEHEGDGDGEACNLSCLVAVGRLQSTLPTSLPKKPRLRPIKFVSRHAMDGKFLFVDQRWIITQNSNYTTCNIIFQFSEYSTWEKKWSVYLEIRKGKRKREKKNENIQKFKNSVCLLFKLYAYNTNDIYILRLSEYYLRKVLNHPG